MSEVILAKQDSVIKLIMSIEDGFLLDDIEKNLSKMIPSETEIEDWDTLSPEQQARIDASLKQIETGQTLTFEEVKQNVNRWLNKSSSPTPSVKSIFH